MLFFASKVLGFLTQPSTLMWLLLVVGQGLFTLVPRPGRITTLPQPSNGDSDDRPDVAGDPAGQEN